MFFSGNKFLLHWFLLLTRISLSYSVVVVAVVSMTQSGSAGSSDDKNDVLLNQIQK